MISTAVSTTSAEAQDVAGNLPVQMAPMPAPEWCKPGTRLVYKISTADPENNGKGAGSSYSVIDVMDIDAGQNKAFLAVKMLFIGGGGTLTGGPVAFSRVEAGGNDFWLNPTGLGKAVQDARALNVETGSGQVQIGNTVYQTIMFVQKADMTRTSVSIDQASGAVVQILVSKMVRGQMQGISVSQLMDRRQRPFMTQASPPPDWALKTQRLSYSGTKTLSIPGGMAMSNPITVNFNLKGAVGNCVSYKVDFAETGVGAQAGSFELFASATHIGGPWLSPAFLAQFKQGQIIDQDQTLSGTTRVSSIYQGNSNPGNDNPGNDNRRFIVFTDDLPGMTGSSTYDLATGGLMHGKSQDAGMNTTTEFSFQGSN